MANRYYHVIDDDITDTRLEGPYDMITCISVLEHIEEPDAAVRNMFLLLDDDGDLDRWLEQNAAVVVEQELWHFWDGGYWTVGNQVLPPRRAAPGEPHELTCLHLRRR